MQSDATVVEKLDALMWVNINAVDRFRDEYNIQLAWIRESPPNTTNLGSSFTARLRDLTSLLALGVRSGELDVRRAVGRHPCVVVVRDAVDAGEHRAKARPARRALSSRAARRRYEARAGSRVVTRSEPGRGRPERGARDTLKHTRPGSRRFPTSSN